MQYQVDAAGVRLFEGSSKVLAIVLVKRIVNS